ncbi:MAG: DUF2065 family protein [Rhizobiaceae bacterium]|nr:DUF2065 family protein [Rhizobiaceae bacterium]
MQDLLIGLAFVLVIEGLIYALFPVAAKKLAAQINDISESSLRIGGVMALAAGVAGIWLIRG